jgi:hypothetical protein
MNSCWVHGIFEIVFIIVLIRGNLPSRMLSIRKGLDYLSFDIAFYLMYYNKLGIYGLYLDNYQIPLYITYTMTAQ